MTKMAEECIVAVIPALNEEEKIGSIVAAVADHTDHVVVVNDGSTDKTGQRAREASAVVVTHEENRGYDRSIDDGFIKADTLGATVVFTFDADGQHSAADIPNVLAPIRARKADVVVGIRPTKARISEYVFGQYTSIRLGVVDPLCGFKAYRIEVYRDAGCFDSHSTIGTQLMLQANKYGYDIAQTGIQLAEREDEPRFGRQLEANWKIFRAIGRLAWFDLTTTVSTN
jgi:glycosyltransferase involved in cell wall biosynthesis